MKLFEVALALVALVTWLSAAVLLIQVAAAPKRIRVRGISEDKRPALAILVPAHNEALLIQETLASLMGELRDGDRVVVVADNCSDDTAKVAAAAGAEVVEREDPARRGKGYALDYGIRHLSRSPPEVVIVVDADCTLDPGTVDRLVRDCQASGRPVQALNLMHASAAGLNARLSEFAWIVKNVVRPLGYHRLGLPCQLMGTGMAFLWHHLRNAPLASASIVEDLALGIDLARAGTPPLFCPDAVVSSRFPLTSEAAAAQRTRWEHGHLNLIVRQAPHLLLDAVRTRDMKLLAMALDLCVPPLALLTLVLFGLLVVAAVLLLFAGASIPLWIAGAAFVVVGAAVACAWARHGRHVVSLADLLFAPAYMLSKVPLYVGFVLRRQTAWVRSKRDEH